MRRHSAAQRHTARAVAGENGHRRLPGMKGQQSVGNIIDLHADVWVSGNDRAWLERLALWHRAPGAVRV